MQRRTDLGSSHATQPRGTRLCRQLGLGDTGILGRTPQGAFFFEPAAQLHMLKAQSDARLDVLQLVPLDAEATTALCATTGSRP